MFGVEEVTVGTRANLVDDIGLEIAVDGSGNIFSITYLAINITLEEVCCRISSPVSEKKVLDP